MTRTARSIIRMAVLVVIITALLVSTALGTPRVRALAKAHPGHAVFVGMCIVLVVLVSLRTGRYWVALLTSALLAWGPRLLAASVPRASAPGSTGSPPRRPRRMSREEALAVMGLKSDATRDEISRRYRELMRAVHPDRGGSDELARRVNEAKTTLLD